MKIVRRGEELNGKTIAFTHIAQFAENITIATQDGCIAVITHVDDECDDRETRLLYEHEAIRYIESSDYLRNSLGKLKIFDLEAYKQKKKEERIKREQEIEARKLKEERELYEKLKAKFEPAYE